MRVNSWKDSKNGVLLLEHIDEEAADQHLREEGGECGAIGAEMAQVDEYRVQNHVGYQPGAIDIERYLGVTGCVVDAGHGGGQEQEREGEGYDAEVALGQFKDIAFQTEQADDVGGQDKEEEGPHRGDADGDAQVVLCQTPGTVQVFQTDALAHGHFGSYFVEQGDGVGGPGKDSYGSDGCHSLAAKSAYPSHVGKAVGHLYKGDLFYR